MTEGLRVRAASRLRSARWRAAHPEEARAASRKASRKYRAAHLEKARARELAYRQAHPEKVRARDRAYRLANPEKVRSRRRNRRARLHAAPGTLTTADWQRILAASKGRCHYCKKRRSLTMDHVIPLAKGGRHSPENIVAACLPCNTSKKDRLWLIA